MAMLMHAIAHRMFSGWVHPWLAPVNGVGSLSMTKYLHGDSAIVYAFINVTGGTFSHFIYVY
jgi:hypothetical protein